jgi:hypothetical protein
VRRTFQGERITIIGKTASHRRDAWCVWRGLSFALAAGLALAASSPATAAPPSREFTATAVPTPSFSPRSISEAERQAVRLGVEYLAKGPMPLWDALTTRSPFRLLGRDEALKEIGVRGGPRANARWELRTLEDSAGRSNAVFAIDSPSGLDQTLVFEMLEERGAWKLHTLRTLAEPSASVLRARLESAPAAEKRSYTLVLAAAAVGLGALLLPLAFVLRGRPVLATVAAALGLCCLGYFFRDVVMQKRVAQAAVPGRSVEAPVQRLAALRPLRDRLESFEVKSGGVELLDVLPADETLRDVAALWLAQSALSHMALDEADALLKRFPSPSPAPWADVLRARLAFLRNRQTDAAVAYGNALASGPKQDGILEEAHDVYTLLGFDSERVKVLDQLAAVGSRAADAYYRMAERQAELEHPEQAEAAFLAGWKLRPAGRHELLALDGLWPVLTKPSILASLSLDTAAEPVPAERRDGGRALSLPQSAAAHVCGSELKIALGEASLTVPNGADLAPATAIVEDAGAENRRAEDRALLRLDALAPRVSVGAFAQPALREEIRLTATALAKRNRWRELALLTAGLSGTEEQVPPDLLMLRAEALRRTNREDMGRRVLVGLAKSGSLEKRSLPVLVYRVGEMLASFEEFDLAVRYIEKGLRGAQRDFAQQRIQQVKTEQHLLAAQAVYPSPHFEIHYPPESSPRTAAEAARVLELERERLEREIPSDVVRIVPVQLLWLDQFRGTFAGSEHLVGLYDGKIRVPLAGIITWTPPLVSIMTHELTHALVAQATDDRAPHWFQEGLAQHLEMRRFRPNHVGFYRESGRALSIPALEEVLRGLPDWSLVEEAYQEAEWMVYYLEMRHGAAGVRKMLLAFRDGLSSEDAFPRAVGVTMADFTRDFFAWSVRDAPKMVTSTPISYVDVGDDLDIKLSQPRAGPTPGPTPPTKIVPFSLRDGSFGAAAFRSFAR